jgi:hypothetical protein
MRYRALGDHTAWPRIRSSSIKSAVRPDASGDPRVLSYGHDPDGYRIELIEQPTVEQTQTGD